jgi:hypothetical protein
MRYLIYEDAVTHKFAFFPLPQRFVDGDALPDVVADRWFDSHEEAIAALPELFDREDNEPDAPAHPEAPAGEAVLPVNSRRH